MYGSIVIEPKNETLNYDKELVMVLSDWTNEKPKNVMRILKLGTKWYNIKKGTAIPLNQVIARGAEGAQLIFWKIRQVQLLGVSCYSVLEEGAFVLDAEYRILGPW
ncbi:MAG: hypothetical protein MUO60_19595 [Clostridiaceae bacterium]|nr:hypothetical protein [Clostridiaceae bacterium]